MTCKNCGAEIGEYVSFCTYCGAPVGNPVVNLSKPTEAEQTPGYSDPDIAKAREALQDPEIGQVPDFNRSHTGWQNNYSGYIPNAAQAAFTQTNGSTWREIKQANCIIGENGQRYNIGWLKFIVYFQLFAFAIIELFNGIGFLSGSVYGEYADLMYAAFPALFPLDKIMGAICLMLCVLGVVTRFMLTGLKRYAPWLYLGVYLCNLVQSLIYLAIVSGITGLSIWNFFDVSDVAQLISSIVMIAVNFVYFKHRMNAFIN